jgi:hypothetical protein
MKKLLIPFLLFVALAIISCKENASTAAAPQISEPANNWKQVLNEALPLLGHRNWIVIADKAFPQQNAPGIIYINTNEKLLPVLQYVLEQADASGHIKPIIYRDRELTFITEEQAKGVNGFIASSQQLFGTKPVQTILHDSVFIRLDAASKLFKGTGIKNQ